MFPYVSVDEHVPTDHAIRKLRVPVDTILQELDDVLASRYTAGDGHRFPRTAAAYLTAAGGLQRAQRAVVGC
jgi:hypothetical protein